MKVLHVIGHIGRGGDTSVVLNIMSKMDKDKYQFDFLTHEGADENVVQQLREQGCNVYVLKGDVRKLGPVKYYWEVRKTIASASVKYDIMHTHTSMQSGVALMAAKHEGIQKRICHSHVSQIQRKANILSRLIATPIFRMLYGYYATDKVACSKMAGDFLFGKGREYKVIYNAVDVQKYIDVDSRDVEAIRKELNCDANDILIGHIASFTHMKNQDFDLVLAKRLQDREDIKFVLVGKGNEFERIKNQADEMGHKVLLIGQRNDVNKLMKSFDCVILPSNPGEGFPVTIIEAQVAGCPCIISDKVTKEVEIGLNLVETIPLEDVDRWESEIRKIQRKADITQRNKIAKRVEEKGFSIQEFVQQWLSIY